MRCDGGRAQTAALYRYRTQLYVQRAALEWTRGRQGVRQCGGEGRCEAEGGGKREGRSMMVCGLRRSSHGLYEIGMSVP